MCKTCNPAEVKRNYPNNNKSSNVKITYYSYNGYFKYCCLEDYFRTKRMIEYGLMNEREITDLYTRLINYKDYSTLYYKNDIILVHKSEKIPNGKHWLGPYNYALLEINIINITNDIINSSELCNELKDTNELLEETKKDLEDTNNELEETNNENKLLKEENIELKNKNIILKKEVEYFNSLKPKYNYLELKQNKKNLHNEYKRIYKLIKKNIGFNLC